MRDLLFGPRPDLYDVRPVATDSIRSTWKTWLGIIASLLLGVVLFLLAMVYFN